MKRKSRSYLSRHVRLLFLACLVVFVAKVAAAGEEAVTFPGSIDTYIKQVLKDWAVPGAAVSVVKDGRIVFSKGYGVLELNRPQRVNEHSLFGIGSVSKTFTTALLARLVDQGKIGWDDTIIEHLPSFRLADSWVTENLTVRDVLSHRVGLDARESNLLWTISGFSRKQAVSRLQYLSPRSRFRDTFTYSNNLIDVLGEMLQAVSGEDWEALLSREVFGPLKMSRSVSGRDELVPAANLATDWYGRAPDGAVTGQAGLRAGVTNVAAPHGYNKHLDKVVVLPWHHEQTNAPAGAVTSSAHDMALYMLAHLSNTNGFLKPETLKEMFSVENIYEVNSPNNVLFDGMRGMGLGWPVHDYKGYKVLAHPGGQIGYASVTKLVPAESLGVSVLINADYMDKYYVHSIISSRLLDHVLGLAFVDNSASLLERASERKKAIEQRVVRYLEELALHRSGPALNTRQYTGRFVHVANGELDISLKAGKLVFQFAPRISGELVHETGETFRLRFDREHYHFENMVVTFSSNESRQVESLTLHLLTNRTDKYYPINFVYQRK